MFKQKNTGMTLIELMLALTITAVILIYVTTIFLASEKNHDMQIALININENALAITKIFKREVNLAGYIGCPKLTNTFPIGNYTDIKFTSKNKLIISDKQELISTHASIEHAELIRDMRSDSIMYIAKSLNVAAQDVLIISSCKSADIFIVDRVESYSDKINKIIATNKLTHRYEKNSQISFLEKNTYQLRQTDRVDAQGIPVQALYFWGVDNRKLELVEGIENINITLAHDNKNNITGTEIELKLKSITPFMLEKSWFIYAGLQS